MKYEDALNYFDGSVEKLRAAFNPPVTHQAVYKWKKEDAIPLHRQYTLNVLSRGKLKIKI